MDIKKSEDSKTCNIVILFKNSQHVVTDTLELEKQISGNENIHELIDDKMLPKLYEMKWPGYGLWAQHEPVTKETIWDDLAYQCKKSNKLVLDCENHNCTYRAIITPVVQVDECVVCLVKRDPKKSWISLACMHACCCEECWEKLDRCPICRKRKMKNPLGKK